MISDIIALINVSFQGYVFPSDLESTAGSEWEGESNAGSQHLSAVSKEQLFNMLQKSRTR